jgi:hypothetical protein
MLSRKPDLRTDEHLDAIEARLAGTLRRVNPPADLVQRLRQRIRIPDRSEIAVRLRDWRTLMLVLGGVISGTVVLIAVARAMFHLFGRRDVG